MELLIRPIVEDEFPLWARSVSSMVRHSAA
jgi:hypothetical protein